MDRPAFLFEEFRDGPPHAPPSDSQGPFERNRIADIQKLYLLYMTARGFSPRRVALELGISRSSAKRIVSIAHDDPESFSFWDFVVRWQSDKGPVYFCRYCGSRWREEPDAVEHAFGHIWDQSQLKFAPLGYA